MSMPSLLKGVQTLKKRKIDENAGTSQVNKIIYFIPRFQFYFISVFWIIIKMIIKINSKLIFWLIFFIKNICIDIKKINTVKWLIMIKKIFFLNREKPNFCIFTDTF